MSDQSRRSTPGGVARPRARALHAIALITTLHSGVIMAAVMAALVRLLSQRHDPNSRPERPPGGAWTERLRTYPASRFRVIGASLTGSTRTTWARASTSSASRREPLTALDPVQRKVLAAWAYDDVAPRPGR